jgi:lactoylglutathione lyase
MTLEHVAIWTNQLEQLKGFYVKYFGGVANSKYTNESKQFQSYFLTFQSGARLELMTMPGIPGNINDTITKQHLGIIHLAFGVNTIAEVDQKAIELRSAGFPILSGPRKTGDGYYEFETLDPDNNRLEVTCVYPRNQVFTKR